MASLFQHLRENLSLVSKTLQLPSGAWPDTDRTATPALDRAEEANLDWAYNTDISYARG